MGYGFWICIQTSYQQPKKTSTMATFKDRSGREWKVELDAPLIEEVMEKHQVNLVNLEQDPLLVLRNDPMILVAVVFVLCSDQVKELGITPVQFAKSLPSPPDKMLEAIRDAIISFFPSGRASHVHEVLTKFEEMNVLTDKLAQAKMAEVISDPNTARRLKLKADLIADSALEKEFPISSSPGGSAITGLT